VWGHGLLGSRAQDDDAGLFSWSELAREVRLVRFDARGHGSSEATLDAVDYRWPALSNDEIALTDALGIDRAVFGGVSMGCATALYTAVSAPERVLALVLVAPPTAWETRPRQARIYRFSAGLIDRFGLSPLRYLSALAGLRRMDPGIAAMQHSVLKHLAHADRRAVAMALRGAASSDLPTRTALRSVDVPALILAWPGDPTHPVSSAEQLATLLPNAQLHVASPRAGIREWQAAVVRFLGEVKRPPHRGTRPPA
jgi:pimeloyl-ACP methyl ester carboxylesterase